VQRDFERSLIWKSGAHALLFLSLEDNGTINSSAAVRNRFLTLTSVSDLAVDYLLFI
jgi:hypothetical protein